MEFSVLMALYSRESSEHLKQSVQSLLSQTARPSQIVIVKDGLLSEQLERALETFLDEYPGLFSVVPLQAHVGLGRALNHGLLACDHELIARMDADDVSHPERFQKQVRFMQDNVDIDVVGSWISEFVERQSNVVSFRKVPKSHEEIYQFGKFRNPTNHMTVMYRKNAVLKSGNYLEFPFFEDYFLWVRMLLNDMRFANLQEPLVFVRIGKDMIDRRRGFEYLRREIAFHRTLYDFGYVTFLEFLRNVIVRLPLRVSFGRFAGYCYQRFGRG
jgi:glycosyltransferase involved in cell wall biosynthesis